MYHPDKELGDLVAQVKKLTTPNTKVNKIMQFLKSKASSSKPQDCLIISRILNFSDAESDYSLPSLSSKQIVQIITSTIKEFKSLSTMLVFYSSWEKCKRTAVRDVDWKGSYQSKRRDGLVTDFNKWIQECSYSDHHTCTQVLFKVLSYFPNFLQFQNIKSTYLEFDSCLIWLSLFTIKNRDDHLCALRTARLVKEVTDIQISDYEKKEHLILRKVVELLGERERRSNSLYLFFDKYTIKVEDIEYFINIREDFFQDLDQKHLCNVFFALTQPGINAEILAFLSKVSGLLKSNQHYFILRTLFEQIVLPVIASKYKTHKKLGNDVFDLVLLYVGGFLAHCLIGKDGVECIMDNLSLVEDVGLKRKWAELAILCCKSDNQLKATIQKELTGMNLKNISSENLYGYLNKREMIWTVTMHNGRKLKKYPQIESRRFKGIRNSNNQCYMISVAQALFATEDFKKMISQLHPEAKEKKLKLLDQLWELFQGDLNIQLQNRKASVDYLQRLGPDEFRLTKKQEDAQEYLGKLFQFMEYQLKKTGKGLDLFNSIFRTEYAISIFCNKCNTKREIKDHQFHYINTYSTKEHFTMKKEEPLDQNYKCQKCSAKNSSARIVTMFNKPKILILHINRFKTTETEIKKILGNHPIKRKIQSYQLMGFIVHKGVSIHAGHYIYYSRVDENRWALFNDNKVTQFNISKDEEFQREFPAENSPYILFYRLQQGK